MSIINVAAEPSENAATFAMVSTDAHRASDFGPFVDHETPDGHFGFVVENVGGVQTYWFRGEVGDPEARIVARTQYIGDTPAHYIGGSFLGGALSPMHVG